MQLASLAARRLCREGGTMPPEGIALDLPGETPVRIRHLVCDFNGTLAEDGELVRGVAERLRALAPRLTIAVLTADTFGTARATLSQLDVDVHIVATGEDKARFVSRLRIEGVATIGNGRNDVAMLACATLGIAVLGREGLAGALVRHATVIVPSIADALDLLVEPRRLKATLRS